MLEISQVAEHDDLRYFFPLFVFGMKDLLVDQIILTMNIADEHYHDCQTCWCMEPVKS